MSNTKIQLKRKSGIIHTFVLRAGDDELTISGDQPLDFVGELSPGSTVQVTAVGTSGARYVLSVDYPGKVNDFKVTIELVSTSISLLSFSVPE